jgi:hypothetical protein
MDREIKKDKDREIKKGGDIKTEMVFRHREKKRKKGERRRVVTSKLGCAQVAQW